MSETLQRDGRQHNLDLLKALAIVCMVLCHPVIMFARYRVGYEDDFWYILADDILGGYIVVAHGFMFAMGMGMKYSRKSAPADMARRGAILLLLAYVLNFVRYGMYFLSYDIVNGAITDTTIHWLFGPDILHFAGLAFIATAFFKKLGLNDIHMLFVGLVLSVIGTVAAGVNTQDAVLDRIIGLFVFTEYGVSTFCFLSWYLFVAAGLVFGMILQGIRDKDAFYLKVMIASGIICAIYVAATFANGPFFLCIDNAYYDASPMEAAGLLSIDLLLLSAFHFLLKKVDASRFKIAIEMSKNITSIYCIHWCAIGVTEFIFCHLLGMTFGYLEMYLYAIALLIASFYLARYYKSLKSKYAGVVA